MKKSLCLAFVLFSLFVFVTSAAAQSVVSVSITPLAPQVPKGRVQQFRATAKLSNGTTIYVTDQATWSSSAPSIADVGALTGGPLASSYFREFNTFAVGTVTVTATYNAISGTTTLKVNPAVAESISVAAGDDGIVTAGGAASAPASQEQYNATITYSDGTQALPATANNLVSWSSTNTSIATVSNISPTKGRVTGNVNGSATIRASMGAVIGSAPVTVGSGTAGLTLSVTVTGASGGVVTAPDGTDTGTDPDINCGNNGTSTGTLCSNSFATSSTVALTATPISGGVFTGWGGACTGTGACNVLMNTAKSVTATFKLPLTLAKAGSGTGTVSSSPVGISCGTACSGQSADFNPGATVVLSATAASGSTFGGWTGACSAATGPCSVSMTQAQSVTATFNGIERKLLVILVGSGTGSVTSDVEGIDCPAESCEFDYPHGTNVTLTAEADEGSQFTSWTGCASLTNQCTVPMTAARTVSASFAPAPKTVSVTLAGEGSGSVTSTPAGITCPGDCSEAYNNGTNVTLIATAEEGSVFNSWTNCPVPNDNACAITGINANYNIIATFDLDVDPNDEPSFDAISPTSFDEDSTSQSVTVTGISPGGSGEESGQTVTLSVSSSNTSIIDPSVDGTNIDITPEANAFGTVTITVTATDDGPTGDGHDNEYSQQFEVTVNPINDEPFFDAISNEVVDDDTGEHEFDITGVSAGGGSFESSQTVTLTASSSNPSAIADPVITGDGATRTLTYTETGATDGPITITVTATDNGNSGHPSDDNEFQRTFTITVNEVNNAPSFDTITDKQIDEDSDPSTFFVNDIDDGDATSEQQVTITVSSSDTSIIDPAVVSSTQIDYDPEPNAFGTVTLTVTATDDGGTPGVPEDDQEYSQQFEVEVVAINDEPSFDAISDQEVNENTGAITAVVPVGEHTLVINNVSKGGGSFEDGQTVTFVAESSDENIVPDPSVTESGGVYTLHYTPAVHASGTVTISIYAQDSGGTDNGGDDTSATDQFTIEVNAINDHPVFDAIADQEFNEDSGAQSVSITGAGPGGGDDEATQNVTFEVSSSDNSIINPSLDGMNINITPQSNAFGVVTITVTATDDGPSGGLHDADFSRTFQVTVNAVNDEPTIAPIDNPENPGNPFEVNEDSGEHSIILFAGPGGGTFEADQTLTFTATSDTTSVIPNPTVVFESGFWTLKYTPVADASNAPNFAIISVYSQDDGGTANGGDDTSPTRQLAIIVHPVNDPPTFDAITVQTYLEDSGEHTIFVSNLSAGPANEGQTATLSVLSSDPNVVSVEVEGNEITLTTQANRYTLEESPVQITVTASDGVEEDDVQAFFAVHVTPVNDAPTINAIDDASIDEDAGLQSFPLVGAGQGGVNNNENDQTLTITAESSNESLIPDPTVQFTGGVWVLSYTPATNANGGPVTITVNLSDDGGTDNGGDNSTTETFDVTVDAVNDEPTLDSISDPATIPMDSGQQSVSLTGITPGGGADEDTQELTVSASSSDQDLIPNGSFIIEGTGSSRTLKYTPAAGEAGAADITVTVQDNGGTSNGGDDTKTDTFMVTVEDVNDAPQISVPGAQSVNEGFTLAFNVGATDADNPGETLTFSIDSFSPNPGSPQPTIDSNTGDFSWTPDFLQAGSYTATFKVKDQDDAFTTASVEITVNNLMSFTVSPSARQYLFPTQTSQLTVTGSYANGGGTPDITNKATYSSGATSVATVGASTGLVTAAAGAAPVGGDAVITISVTNSGQASQTRNFTVANVFGGVGNQNGTAAAARTISGTPNVWITGNNTTTGAALMSRLSFNGTSYTTVWSQSFASSTFNGLALGTSTTVPLAYGVGSVPVGTCNAADVVGADENKTLFRSFAFADGVVQACPGAAVNYFAHQGLETYRGAAAVSETNDFVYAVGDGNPCAGTADILGRHNTLTTGGAASRLIPTATGGGAAKTTDPTYSGALTTACGGSSYSVVGKAVTVFGGNIYIVGTSGGTGGSEPTTNRPYIAKYPSTLSQTWRTRMTDRVGSLNAVVGLNVSGTDFLFAVGSITSNNNDYLIERYNDSGTRTFSELSGGSGDDQLTGVAVVGSRLFAVGHTTSSGAGGSDMVVMEINPSTGLAISTTVLGGANNDKAISVSSDGTDLWIVGETTSFAINGNTAGQSDQFVLRYRP